MEKESTNSSLQRVQLQQPGSIEGGADHEFEKKLVRKLDKHIVPMIMLLYLFSFLDRVNIGNARLYGLEEDLGLKGNQFQTSVSILFVTYLAFEIPSNLVLKKFTPRRYIAAITTVWGIIATCTGLVNSYGSLLACRLLLGAVEAGLFPGLAVYLTFFYTRRELALRIGYLFVSAALAGACGGLLAYGIGFLDGRSGMKGWRWILIIEGLPTIVLGSVAYFFLADSPEEAGYLNEEEKRFMVARRGREVTQTTSAQEFHWEDVKKCFLDWKCWAFAFAQFGIDTMLYGFSTFLPTIIKAIGHWSTAQVQALTIPCYALGAITYLIVAHISDKQQRRGMYTVSFACISIVGYGILLSNASSGVHYFGCFLVAMGLYVSVGLPLAWLPNNCPRYGKRTAASGFQLTVGNASGIMAPFIYVSKDSPRYIKGHAVSLSMVGAAAIIYTFLWYWFSKLNSSRERGEENEKIVGLSEEDIAELGDESPRFRYTI
ncbi:major facilitator superfamily domain-containing protein [Tuber borchii]|uniref:Major facilitator superfamily domain-containing protein n=1 Tax=Tuber borchii TaxID=42251 RepID=A0A2T6ZL08_TUBBO|nr:major facilitator superfamily domain-containing protein [Tuber borchii]